MSYQLEVCVDNIESIPTAIRAGATRIELCSSLALGGLTPSAGFMHLARTASSVPVYAMIRPRQGDFLFNEAELEIMLADIRAAKAARLDGIVIGVLTAEGDVDTAVCQRLIEEAGEMGVTFHRAIDQCRDAQQALEDVIRLGCERILTSGLKSTAEQGIDTIASLHQQAGDRIRIMAGAGVNENNAARIMQQTGISEIHLSGKTHRPSQMTCISDEAKMGASDLDDFQIPVTGYDAVHAVSKAIR